MDGLSLQQLEVFRIVAESGSFSAAARRLGRAQSAVSYAVATLEGTLGVTLFDREGRRPELTAAGRVLLEDARAVGGQVERLVGRAMSLRRRVEAELQLVVDVMFPVPTLVVGLRAMSEAFPEVAVRIRTETLGAVVEVVRAGDAHIGICPAVDAQGEDLDRQHVPGVTLVPVVSPDHPLATRTVVATEHLALHVQIVLSTRPGIGPDRGVFSPRTWRVGDLATRHALVREGFGWANMPLHVVESDLGDGRLVELPVVKWPGTRVVLPMVAVTCRASPPGPAGEHLLAHLKA